VVMQKSQATLQLVVMQKSQATLQDGGIKQ
jgi:hypothetical protein